MKHVWQLNDRGDIQDFAWELGYHNGVSCVVCGKSVCVHCNPDYDELDDCIDVNDYEFQEALGYLEAVCTRLNNRETSLTTNEFIRNVSNHKNVVKMLSRYRWQSE